MSKWLDNAVFYEIYPQSFNDTNADGIGDFQGIIEKLDYIKELGCNAIWINPCFLSPFGDAGYDVADYCRVAPRYGTNEDLKRVFEEAHKRDMHVLLDLVPGHTSVEHPWFKESMKADRNEFTDRYVWTNNVWEAPEGMGSLRGISERDGACAINFFSNQVRKFLDAEFPDAAMVSEWGEPDKSLQGGFHMDFLLHFGPSHYNDLFRCDEPFFSKRGKGDISEFVETYKTNYNKTAQKGLICIPSGNHDMDRLARRLQGNELKISFAFLLSMPGAPFIYYGDEIGMRYVEGLKSVEGGYNRTGSRSPMQWDDSTNAGFSSAPASDLYITMDPGKDRPTAKAQMADPDSLYHEVKKLIQIRQSSKALLSRGTIEFVYAEKNQYPLAYVREAEGEKVLVIINPSDKEQSFPYSAELKDALYTIGGKAESKDGTITIPAQSAGFYHI